MLGPIAFDLCGAAGAGQAIGFLLALCSVPLTLGPPVAGYIYDQVPPVTAKNIFWSALIFSPLQVGNYVPAFLAAGVPPMVGAVAMCSIRCIHSGLS